MRTEEEILKDFEQLGYVIEKEYDPVGFNQDVLYFRKTMYKIHRADVKPWDSTILRIILKDRKYRIDGWSFITLEEHKLLHELFECWGWL